MASSNGPHDKDVKFEDSFRRYLKRSDLRSPVPDSLMAQLKRDTPLHPTAPTDKDTLVPRDGLAPDDESSLRPDTQQALSQWTSASLEGTHLQGIYRLEQRVAKGGMAWVYRGWHENLKVPVAVKLLYPELVEEPELYQRFLNEARMLAQMRHPNIVQVYDVLEEKNLLGMVLEWIDGVDLFAWQNQQQKTASLRDIESIFLPILEAMHYIHEKGVVHRDIKPDNILMNQTPDGWVPKVADFGIAKMKDQLGRVRTRTGIALGTPMYMSPEQIRDSKNVDGRADIYSLGVVLFEWLTGRPPFAGDDSWVFYQHMHEAPPSLHDFCRGVPEPLNVVVQKFLAKDPKQRFATCGEAAQALAEVCREFANIQPVPLENPKLVVRPPQHTTYRRQSALLPWAIVVLAVLLGLGWWGLNRSQRSNLVDSGTQAPRRGVHPAAYPSSQSKPSIRERARVEIVLRSVPGKAEVWQNDRLLGVTPFPWRGEPGEVGSFELRSKGYNPRSVSVTLSQQKEQEKTWVLEPIKSKRRRTSVHNVRRRWKRTTPPREVRGRKRALPKPPIRRATQTDGPPQGTDLNTMMAFPRNKPRKQPSPPRRQPLK